MAKFCQIGHFCQGPSRKLISIETPFGKISSHLLDSSLSLGSFEPPHFLLSNPLANFRQIRRFPRGPLSQLICFRQTLWRIFAKFAIFVKFAAFAKFAALERSLLPKSFALSNPLANFCQIGHFCQICHFRQIRRFRQIRLFPRGPLSQPICFRQTVWRIFAKFAVFAKFATFTKFAAFDGALLRKSFASSNPLANVSQIRHFRQIHRFCQIRRLPRGALSHLICFGQTLWQIFAKFAIFAAFTRALLARSFAFLRTLALFRQIRRFR